MQSTAISLEIPKKHGERLSKLSHYKKRTTDFSRWIRENKATNFWDENVRMICPNLEQCSNYLAFKQYETLDRIILQRGNFCRYHTLCPICAINRAAKNVRELDEKYDYLAKDNPKLKLYYCVLTIKNDENLERGFTHLEHSFRLLIERRRAALCAKKGNPRYLYALNSAFSNVLGGAYSIEIKKGAGSKQWHPHVNLLLLSETEIDKSDLQTEWLSITKDSFITHLSEKPCEKQVFLEIAKYALKFSDLSFEDNFEAYETLKRRRLCGCFGKMRGLGSLIKENRDNDKLELEDEPYLELIYRYLHEQSVYGLASVVDNHGFPLFAPPAP
jgi:hypothetical protein